jgi:WLM domain
MQETKYTKNVMWLRPFVESAKTFIPTDKITHIKGYKVRIGHTEKAQGITTGKKKGCFSINIRMWDITDDGKRHIRRRYYHVLETLAHELAHVTYWEHSPGHFRLTARILERFTEVLEVEGISDTSFRVSKELIHKYIEKDIERKRAEYGVFS